MCAAYFLGCGRHLSPVHIGGALHFPAEDPPEDPLVTGHEVVEVFLV